MKCTSHIFESLLLCVCIFITGPERVLGHDSVAVAAGDYPSAAAVQMEIGGSYKSICGGVLVTPSFVLSAASCFEGDTDTSKPFQVLLGALDVTLTATAAPAEIVTGKKITVHPKYDKANFNFDVAMLELAKEVVSTDQIKPVSFARADDEMTHLDCTGVGWGMTKVGAASAPWNNALQKITLSVQSRDLCSKSFGDPKYTDESTTCTIDPATTVQHCTVDRGGGLYCLDRFANTPFILAIASDDLGSCATPERFTLFTRASHQTVVAFIKNILPPGSREFLELEKMGRDTDTTTTTPETTEATTNSGAGAGVGVGVGVGVLPFLPLPSLSLSPSISIITFIVLSSNALRSCGISIP